MKTKQIGFVLTARDDDSYMLGDEIFRPANSGQFFDWRFGSPEVPHPATCDQCGRKVNRDYVSETFRVRRRASDLVATYDGYLLVSRRFKEYCVHQKFPGTVFVPLPADAQFLWLRSNRMLPFDVEARRTRKGDFCDVCRAFHTVAGATPAFLTGVSEPIPEGFYRTDVEFGSGHEQSPLIIVANQTFDRLLSQGFKGIESADVLAA